MTEISLDAAVTSGSIELGRGNIISSKDVANKPGDYPIYSSSAQGKGEFGRYADFMFDEELITWSVDGGGRFFFRPKHKFSVTNVSGYMRIKDDVWNKKYVYYSLDFQHASQAFDYQTKAHPSVIRHIYKLKKFGTNEQSKIAEILATVDQAIEQTEALIAKQQRIKTGLMQDLLTRGIDEHGQLRTEQTHAFKDSPLGRIPVEWKTDRIEDLLANVDPAMRSGPFGSALLKEELTETGVPLLGIDNVHVERFVDRFVRYVDPKKAQALKRYLVRPDDIMITIMGTVGRCCIVPSDIGLALSSKHTWTISLDPQRYRPYLACIQINHAPWVLSHFAKDEQGGIMSSIKSDTLRSTVLPVPPLDEALRIESRLRALDADLEVKNGLLNKLRHQKTALMQDLLTGYKRVTDLLEPLVG